MFHCSRRNGVGVIEQLGIPESLAGTTREIIANIHMYLLTQYAI
jgi:hypothetical protein